MKPAHGEYPSTEPGKSRKIKRAFENSPALIPHDLTGMLPIAETNNMCLGCHMPEAARAINATPLPKVSTLSTWTRGRTWAPTLTGKGTTACSVMCPKVDIPEPIKNTFKPDFRKKKDMTSSSLLESLNEGVKADR
ncbi:MAG: nitrate reductase cytochrome c-type subunit [Comamonadaceae bacterium]|nr:nitrate reductase cytochrome c-type subunit [Comamonadaceae bacterium]